MPNIWDAGGGSTRFINTPANWDNDVVPDLVSGTQTLTFAAAATSGSLHCFFNIKINILGLILNFNGNFRTQTTNASFSPSIGSAGILAQPNSNISVLYTLSQTGASGVGATITSDQTWMVENRGSFFTRLSVDGIAGEFNLIKDGNGTLIIARNSLRSNPTKSFTLKNGILQLQAQSALNSSVNAPLFINGGELRLSTNSDTTFTGTNITVGGNASITTTRATSAGKHPIQTIGNLSIGSYTLTVGDIDIFVSTGDAVLQTGAVTLTGDAVFNVFNTDNAGVLKLGAVGESGGSRGFTKTGNGTIELTSESTYTGVTNITEGNFVVNANATGTTVNIQSGTKISGSGAVGGMRVFSGGTISAGNSPGTIIVSNNATLDGASNYNWQVASLNKDASNQSLKGIGWDYLNIGGVLNLSGLDSTPMNLNLWSLSSVNPDVNGTISGWPTSHPNTWAIIGAAGGIQLNGTQLSPNTDYTHLFNINTNPTNGTGGWSGELPMNEGFRVVTHGDAKTLYIYAPQAVPSPPAPTSTPDPQHGDSEYNLLYKIAQNTYKQATS